MKSLKGKSLKGVSLAMGIFTSFFTQNSEAFPKQKDVLQVISRVKASSVHLQQQTVLQSQQFFNSLAELTNNVALLNVVVRSMKSPERVIDDLIAIDLMLNKLADDIRGNFYQHFREQLEDRYTFRTYVQTVANFSVFAVNLRQEMGRYLLIPSDTTLNQSDLDVLIEDSNKRYGING